MIMMKVGVKYDKDKKANVFSNWSICVNTFIGGTTYAFFNYTRVGSANTVSTGRISFNTSQGTAVNLTNAFPIDVSEGIANDNTKVGNVTINVRGDTTYSEGIV